MPGDDEQGPVFRPDGAPCLHIPSPDPASSAAFYRAAFAWNIRDDEDSPAFEDGTGQVIDHFIRDLPVAGHAGHLPYVSVESVDETLDNVTANGGTIIRPPSPGATCGSRQPTIRPETAWRLAAGTAPPMMSSLACRTGDLHSMPQWHPPAERRTNSAWSQRGWPSRSVTVLDPGEAGR